MLLFRQDDGGNGFAEGHHIGSVYTDRGFPVQGHQGLAGRVPVEAEAHVLFSLPADGQLQVTKDGGTINAITGATITSRAVTDGVNTAAAYVATLG